MIAAMLTLEGRERSDAEKAILDVCVRVQEGDDPAKPILSALDAAAPGERAAMLPLVGRVGGKRAFDVVKTALKAKDTGMRDAAVDALCYWPDDTALPLLEQVAGSAAKPAQRSQAVRAYVRLAMERRHGSKQMLSLLRKAMDMAPDDKVRNLVLKRAIQAKSVAALRFVVPYLDRPEFATEAGRSVIYLAGRREVVPQYRDEVKNALDKTIASAKDKWVQQEAQRLRKGM